MSTCIYRNATISQVASRTEEEDYPEASGRGRTWNGISLGKGNIRCDISAKGRTETALPLYCVRLMEGRITC